MTASVSTPAPHRPHRARLFALAALATLITLLVACNGGSSSPGVLAENQRILASCDRTHPPASFVVIDGTGSSATNDVFAARMTAIEHIVHITAVCSGYLRVTVFSSSSVATTVLFDGSLTQPGATDNARLQRIPGAVSSAVDQIRKAYGPAVAKLDPNGSDITGQYANAAQWIAQLGGPYRLHLYLLTDGFQNVGIHLDAGALSAAQATALADQVTMPKLPGASVVVAGLGHVTGAAPQSDVVTGLVAYYNELCRMSGAATCSSVSDFQQAAGQ